MTLKNVGQATPGAQLPPQAAQPPLQPVIAYGPQLSGEAPQTAALAAAWGNIPEDLRRRAQWCLAAADKRPMTISGRPASPTDPATWNDFDSVCATAAKTGAGIGYVLSANDPLTCIDIDVKSDTPPSAIHRFERIVAAFDTYTERSRSGKGLHLWTLGNIGRGRRRDGVEVYSQERFIICTGDVWMDRPVAGRQDLLSRMVAEMSPPSTVDVELSGVDGADWALAQRASEDSGELGRLFAGDWEGRYPSQSEADLALATLLLPHTDSTGECWSTFRLSKLGARGKAGRADYARSTIAMASQHLADDTIAVEHGRSVAEALFWPPKPPQNLRHFRLMRDGDLGELPPLRWLVKRVIPDAGIGAIYGDSGTFKSFLTLDLLAHISNGQEWFGHRVTGAPAVYVPFEGQGGIPNRVQAWRLAQAARRTPNVLFSVAPPDDITTNVAVIMDPLNLRERGDRDKLVDTLTEKGWAGGVLCIDTLAHASSGLDENSSAMAEMISIFRDLQHRLGGVILLVHHSGKDQSRGMRGWSGLHAAMDFVVECQHQKDSGQRDAQFHLSKVKDGTTGTAFKFSMQVVHLGLDDDGDPITSLAVVPAPGDGEGAMQWAGGSPFKTAADDAALAAEDDQFVDQWVRELAAAGLFPTGRYLESKRATVRPRRKLTQSRLRDAVERLKVEGRLVDEPNARKGHKWLRPIDRVPPEAGCVTA
jgi:hypothetical protein